MIRVLYTTRTKNGRDLLCGTREPTIADIARDYVVVHEEAEGELLQTPDDVFEVFNGQSSRMKNPLESYPGLCFVEKWDTHTSMSVGDIVQIGDTVYICKFCGWKEIPWPPEEKPPGISKK